MSVQDFHSIAETKFVEANGVNFAYRIFGKEDGVPLVFLHHFTASIDEWDPKVTNGLAENFKVVIFDNRGIGATQGETPKTIKGQSDDTAAFIKALGFEKVNILSISMGGFVAQQLVRDYPQLVDKLILASTAPKGGQGVSEIKDVFMAAIQDKTRHPKEPLFYNDLPIGKEVLARMEQRKENRVPATAMASIQAQIVSQMDWSVPENDGFAYLEKITNKVLVINGKEDRMIPTANSYTLFQHLPNAFLSLYPNSGHGAIFQFADHFVWEATKFLQE